MGRSPIRRVMVAGRVQKGCGKVTDTSCNGCRKGPKGSKKVAGRSPIRRVMVAGKSSVGCVMVAGRSPV